MTIPDKLATEQIRHRVEQEAGNAVVSLRHLAPGNNASLYLADMQNGERLVVKASGHAGARLDLEGWMLRYLQKNSDLPVPKVLWARKEMLVMTCLPNSGVIDADAQIHAADLLADLHQVTASEYGLDRDTLIGPLTQKNKPEQDWLVFFRDHRLLYMATEALKEGRIDNDLMKDIETLAGKLDRYIDAPAKPSLLHGDAWGGNVLAVSGRITGFIDPAIYYGDPEIELAFSTMFGTFGETFFKRYNEHRPVREGFWDVRKNLYNLYPLLVHARLFGDAYIGAINKTIRNLV